MSSEMLFQEWVYGQAYLKRTRYNAFIVNLFQCDTSNVLFVYSVLGFGSESNATMNDLFNDETIDRKITFNGMLFILHFIISLI